MKQSELLELFEKEGIVPESLSEKVVALLQRKSKKIAVAESCTGGFVSQLITDISGASAVFDCGICSYANEIKHRLLSVQEETLSTYGAVSEKTAMEMARGMRKLAVADIGISTTGIAGPLGGSQYKPVGLVYVGISTQEKLLSHKLNLSPSGDDSRREIRRLASYAALYFALREIEEL